MIALITVGGTAIAIDPEHIESVEQGAAPDTAVIVTVSGGTHVVARSYRYVCGIIRKYWEERED